MKSKFTLLTFLTMLSASVFALVEEEIYLSPGGNATITLENYSYTVFCEGRRGGKSDRVDTITCTCTNGLFSQGNVTGPSGSDFNQMCNDQVFIGTTATNCRKVN